MLGSHDGTAFYTIGQRKGLGITHPTPLYVQKIESRQHEVVVGDNDGLFNNELVAEQINWVAASPDEGSFEADVKIRYLHQPGRATVTPLTANSARVIFSGQTTRDHARAVGGVLRRRYPAGRRH